MATNFKQLQSYEPQLARLGLLAEKYFPDDPNTALLKVRQFGELLAQSVAAYSGSTQTLVAVSRLNVSSRSAARSRIVLPTPSTSSTTTRVPGTRFRSWR